MRKTYFITLLFCFSGSLLFSQNVIRAKDKFQNLESDFEEVTTWHDGTQINDSKADGVIFKKHNGKFYMRIIANELNIKWFGAKGDGKSDDTQAFKRALTFASTASNNYRLFIPEGEYIIKNKLTILGNNNFPIIQGAGMRNTILNFSQNKDDVCIQVGLPDKNSLNGRLMDFQIKGKPSTDGIHLYGSPPYGVAWFRFENIYIHNVNNGLVDNDKINHYSSHYFNIHIERFYGKGMIIHGGYNTYSGIFIVQPSGETNIENPNKLFGSKTLALDVFGGDNSFYDVQTEDQIKISGGYNTFNGLVVEHLLKGQMNDDIGKSVIWVGGANTSFNKLKLVGSKSSMVDYLMTIFSQNVTIMNAVYEDMGRKDMKVAYPFYPSAGSSGVMLNCIPRTVYGLNNPTFAKDTKNWTFINVQGEGDSQFSIIKNEGLKISSQEKNKLQPEEGMLIYNTTTHNYEFWNGSQWKSMSK